MSFEYKGLPVGNNPARKKRIAIVTSDTMGPTKNGGVGTACYSLAAALAEDGHDITVCFVSNDENHLLDFKKWQQFYASKKIRLLAVPRPRFKLEFEGPSAASYAAYVFLREAQGEYEWDVLHFPDMHGLGYYTMQAKKTLGEFQRTVMCVTFHGPTRWAKEYNHEGTWSLDDLELNFLEQQSAENSDILVLPTQSIAAWAAKDNCKMPANTFVEANILALENAGPYDGPLGRFDDIVFFGRLETRKGLVLFIDAIKRMDPRLLENRKVIFLGKVGRVGDVDADVYINGRLKQSSISFQIISSLGAQEALDFLVTLRPLVVIPSKMETMGYTLCEAVQLELPVIASRIPAFEELLNADADIFFDLNENSLKDKIETSLKTGVSRATRKICNEEVRRNWLQWHNTVEATSGRDTVELGDAVQPFVSICIAHRDRPVFLEECVRSLRQQTYRNFEILVGDDGSVLDSSISYLKHLSESGREDAIRVFRFDPSGSPGAVRNQLVKQARGEFVLFMDDDNLAYGDQLETFVKAQLRTGADILTCPFDRFVEASSEPSPSRWVPLGACSELGLFVNAFGDMNALVKKSVFVELGGLNETKSLGGEDWEFFARASLKGFRIEVVPQALFQYRQHSGNYSRRVDADESRRVLTNTYAENLRPDVMGRLLRFMFEMTKRASGVQSFYNKETPVSLDIYQDYVRNKALYPKPLYNFEARDFLTQAQANPQLSVEIQHPHAVLKASGNDPIFIINDLQLDEKKRTRIEAQMTSTKPTRFTIYFMTNKHRYYCESQTCSGSLLVGENHLSMVLNPGAIGPLRFDPGGAAGTYVLKGLEISSEA